MCNKKISWFYGFHPPSPVDEKCIFMNEIKNQASEGKGRGEKSSLQMRKNVPIDESENSISEIKHQW